MDGRSRYVGALLGAALALSAACGDDDGTAGGGTGGGVGGGTGGDAGAGGGAGDGGIVDPPLDPGAAVPAPASSCILAYDLGYPDADDVALKIRNAPIPSANFDLPQDADTPPPPSFSGRVVLRVETSGGDAGPAQILDGGTVQILYYRLTQYFQTSAGGATILTDIDAYSPSLAATDNQIEVATGTIDTDAVNAHVLRFPDCTLPAGYDATTRSYTPDVEGVGTGCLAPYRSVGTITCSDISDLVDLCATGGLVTGTNAQNETWEQPLHDIELSNDLGTLDFTADPADPVGLERFMLGPDRNPVRTYTHWLGTIDAAASTCDDL